MGKVCIGASFALPDLATLVDPSFAAQNDGGLRVVGNLSLYFTHPDYAALVDPLFACGGKRVGWFFLFCLFYL